MSIATQPPGLHPPSSPSASNSAKKRLPPPVADLLRLLQGALRRLSTPALLQLLLGATWLCVLFFWIAVYTGVGVYRNGLQRVGRDVAPGFTQAPHIEALLADMDDSVIHLLLIPHHGYDLPAARDARDNYDARHQQLAAALIQATETITSGDHERAPLIQLQNEVGRYDALVERALTLHELASDAKTDDAKAEAKVREAYDAASKKIDSVIIPLADALQAAKQSTLEETYISQYQASGSTLSGLIFSGLILLAMLGLSQYTLFRRTRRLINLGLGAATVLTVLLLFWTGISFNNVATQFLAIGDNFTRLKKLAEAHALAYSAKADESRSLLAADADARTHNADTFNNTVVNISTLLNARTPDSNSTVNTSLSDAISQLDNYQKTYQALEKQIDGEKRTQALQTYLGPAMGEPNTAFNNFDLPMETSLNDSQNTFKTSVDASFDLLDNHELICSLLALAIAFSAFVGIAPRLKEYSF